MSECVFCKKTFKSENGVKIHLAKCTNKPKPPPAPVEKVDELAEAQKECRRLKNLHDEFMEAMVTLINRQYIEHMIHERTTTMMRGRIETLEKILEQNNIKFD